MAQSVKQNGIKNDEKSSGELVFEALDHISAYWRSHLINTSIKLNIYDHLSKNAMSTEKLAEATETHSPTLFRLLRALSSIGVFKMDEDDKWTTTPMATAINTNFKHLSTVFMEMQPSFSRLTETIKTGKCYFEQIYGDKVYDWYEKRPESMEKFTYAMQEYGDALGSNLLETYDFTQFHHIIDIGGGKGWLMSKILRSAPNARGTVYDRAIVVEVACENEVIRDIRDRISFIDGNFLENVPPGGDCYILHNVIVDYNDEKALQILRNIAEKMNENTKLVIIKQTLDTSFGAMFDMYMLVVQDGKERNEKDFEIILSKVGLRVNKFLITGKGTCEIVEVMKILEQQI